MEQVRRVRKVLKLFKTFLLLVVLVKSKEVWNLFAVVTKMEDRKKFRHNVNLNPFEQRLYK